MAQLTHIAGNIKIKPLLYLLYYADACNELAKSVSAFLPLNYTSPYKELTQGQHTNDNTYPTRSSEVSNQTMQTKQQN